MIYTGFYTVGGMCIVTAQERSHYGLYTNDTKEDNKNAVTGISDLLVEI
jgi:hypothetical protein